MKDVKILQFGKSCYETIASPRQFEGFAGMIKGGKKCVKSVLGGHHLVSIS